jgi:hypothetical protein
MKLRLTRTVAYRQTLMQSIHISRKEYANAYGTEGWRKAIRTSVNTNYDHPQSPPPAAPPPSQRRLHAPDRAPYAVHFDHNDRLIVDGKPFQKSQTQRSAQVRNPSKISTSSGSRNHKFPQDLRNS